MQHETTLKISPSTANLFLALKALETSRSYLFKSYELIFGEHSDAPDKIMEGANQAYNALSDSLTRLIARAAADWSLGVNGENANMI